ncbi:hypothetical protein DVH05_009785 [Phytophthora capsici]|nr:hypothetical protein DVH05_009785 [Phytophthora capsici]
MLGFFVLVKHIREHSKFFMLQFKSLYRPDDHQNTQKRIILGNIAPCMFTLMFFKWLTAVERALTFILVFITGVGDGLAEQWVSRGDVTSTGREASSQRTGTPVAVRAVRACSCRVWCSMLCISRRSTTSGWRYC